MLQPVVDFFERLIENFSWRRLTVLLSVLASCIAGLWLYESYTASFQLSRIEKQIILLEKLAEVQSQLSAQQWTPEMRATLQNLQQELRSTTGSSTATYELLPWAKKVLSAAAAWLVFMLFILLIPAAHTATGRGAALLGMTVVAAPFIALAAALPTFESAWLNYWAYPVGHILLLVVVILWIQRMARRRYLTRLNEDALKP